MDTHAEYMWWSVCAAMALRDNLVFMRDICLANAIGWAARSDGLTVAAAHADQGGQPRWASR